MAAFTFIVRQSDGIWTAKQHGGGAGALETSSASTWELQRKLTSLALASGGTGAVSSSFTLITPTSAIAQVIVTGGGFHVGSAPPASGSAATAAVPAAEAPPEVDKVEEEDSDDDNIGDIFGPSLWD
jgi:large subunit ribosomal protein LP1